MSTGFNNTILGSTAGLTSNGNANVFVGKDAGSMQTTGDANVMVGIAAQAVGQRCPKKMQEIARFNP